MRTKLTTDLINTIEETSKREFLRKNPSRMTKTTINQDYLEFTRTTAIYPTEEAIPYLVLGLTSEAGEVAGVLKKFMRDTPDDLPSVKEKLLSESADCLWYLVRLMDELGYTLDDLIEYNTQKLTSRLERGKLMGSGDNR